MISDLELARCCQDSYSNPASFDYVDDGSATGVWVAVKRYPETDVMVFRGSDCLEDWLRDFDAIMINDLRLGLVHAGFFLNMDRVKLPDLRPRYVITGHSLGAARAALMGAFNKEPPARIALFGCPRPGANKLKTLLAGIPINSYKNRHDPVTSVPVQLLDFPYVHVREQIHLDGSVSNEFPGLLKDHHIACYIDGLSKKQAGVASDGQCVQTVGAT